MRLKRGDRNFIASVVGDQAVDELERWNSERLDSLEEFGVEMPWQEQTRQRIAMRAVVESDDQD